MLLFKIDRGSKEMEVLESEELQGRIDKDYWLLIKKKSSTKDFDWMIPLGNPFDVYILEAKPTD